MQKKTKAKSAAKKKGGDATGTIANKPKTCEYFTPEKIVLTTGAVILNPGSTKKYKTGEWRTYKPIIDFSKCIKCGKCWMVCPDAAIVKKKDGKFEIDYNYCKGCLLCIKECPSKALRVEIEEK